MTSLRRAAVLHLLLPLSLWQHGACGQQSSFDAWDKNGDGKLVREELPENARRNFDRADADKSGAISRDEHRRFTSSGERRRPGVPNGVRLVKDQFYAGSQNPRQALDLVLPQKPASDKPLPVIVFIHGGAWRAGSKNGGVGRLAGIVKEGNYAGVTVGYRLSGEAKWPAQIHDCKAAIRWVRANAGKHGLDAERIAVWGTSAGGHLVAMLGVSGGVEALEGTLGPHLDQSSRVTAVVNYFGPSQLLTMGDFPSKMDHNAPDSPESQLIGAPIQDNKERARSASPMNYITRDDAPMLLVHGDKDPLVPVNQSEVLEIALEGIGVPVVFLRVDGGGHGGFRNPAIDQRLHAFLDWHLRGIGKVPGDVTLPNDGGPR